MTGPLSVAGTGAYLVGSQIAPGIYRSAGPLVAPPHYFAGIYTTSLVGFEGSPEAVEVAFPSAPNGVNEVRILETDYAFFSSGFDTWTRVGDVPSGFALRMPNGSWQPLWTATKRLFTLYRHPDGTRTWSPHQVSAGQILSVRMADGSWQRVARVAGRFTDGDGSDGSTEWFVPVSWWMAVYTNYGTSDQAGGDLTQFGKFGNYNFPTSIDSTQALSYVQSQVTLDGSTSQVLGVVILYQSVNLSLIRWMRDFCYFGKSATLRITCGGSQYIELPGEPISFSDTTVHIGFASAVVLPRSFYETPNIPGGWLAEKFIALRPTSSGFFFSAAVNTSASPTGGGAVCELSLDSLLDSGADEVSFVVTVDPIPFAAFPTTDDAVGGSSAGANYSVRFD